jgi:hypothetical protein
VRYEMNVYLQVSLIGLLKRLLQYIGHMTSLQHDITATRHRYSEMTDMKLQSKEHLKISLPVARGHDAANRPNPLHFHNVTGLALLLLLTL